MPLKLSLRLIIYFSKGFIKTQRIHLSCTLWKMFSILFRLVKKGLNKEEKVMPAKYNLGLEAQRLEWLKLKPMMDIEGTYYFWRFQILWKLCRNDWLRHCLKHPFIFKINFFHKRAWSVNDPVNVCSFKKVGWQGFKRWVFFRNNSAPSFNIGKIK